MMAPGIYFSFQNKIFFLEYLQGFVFGNYLFRFRTEGNQALCPIDEQGLIL